MQDASDTSRRNPELTRAEIFEAAMDEFAEHGLVGGRVETIVQRTNTSKRMIYYYYGSKGALYQRILRHAYRTIRQREIDTVAVVQDPVATLRALVEATLDHFEHNVRSARVIAFENLQCNAENLKSDPELRDINASALQTLEDILAAGQDQGVFRSGPEAPTAVGVHQLISSLALFRIYNRESFRHLFDRDMLGKVEKSAIHRLVDEAVLGYVVVPELLESIQGTPVEPVNGVNDKKTISVETDGFSAS